MLKKTRTFKKHSNDKMPLARADELVVQEFENEILIYDMKSDKAHSLNEITSIVWQNCDEKTTFGKTLKVLEEVTNSKLDIDFVLLTLNELSKENLLASEWNLEKHPTISRRKMLGRYAVPVMSLPVIMSLVAPTSAQMASCLPTGQIGCNATPCCPGNTCTAVVGPGGIIENVCVATP